MVDVTARKPPTVLACSRCRRRKTRCVNSNDGYSPCDACTNCGLACVYNASQQHDREAQGSAEAKPEQAAVAGGDEQMVDFDPSPSSSSASSSSLLDDTLSECEELWTKLMSDPCAMSFDPFPADGSQGAGEYWHQQPSEPQFAQTAVVDYRSAAATTLYNASGHPEVVAMVNVVQTALRELEVMCDRNNIDTSSLKMACSFLDTYNNREWLQPEFESLTMF